MNKQKITDTLKWLSKRAWIVVTKCVSVVGNILKMLWPDKTFTSRLCFGMAFLCTAIFIINACFTLIYSCGLIIVELGNRTDKELKMAKIICDREQAKSDTTTTDQLFKMIMDAGIDNRNILCITDSTNKVLACNKKLNAADSIANWTNGDDVISFDLGAAKMDVVSFNNTMNLCSSDTIVGTDYRITLLEPLDKAMDSATKVVQKVGISSLVCFGLLVFCYLVMLFLLRRTTSRNEQIENELDVAASIQKQMIPLDFSAFPEAHGYDLYGLLKPAKSMGGDLLDYVLHDDKLFFCIGDVSGKGMPAALFMSEVHVLFHHVLTFTQEPANICSAINRSMAERNETNMFCTLFVGVLDFATNILHYCNAGHNPPAMIDSEGNTSLLDVVPNIALGFVGDFQYQEQQMEWKTGTILVTYTDGVTEAESINKRLFGEDVLLNTLKNSQGLGPKQVVDLIMNKLSEHAMLTDQSDDITMVVLKK